MISNLDKQLKEKNNIIASLEQQLNRESPKKTTSKLDNELKEKNLKIYALENELEKVNSVYEKNVALLKNDNDKLQADNNKLIADNNKLMDELNQLKLSEEEEEEEEEEDEKYPITFKKVDYLVDSNDNVYKDDIIVGKLKNNKVQFFK